MEKTAESGWGVVHGSLHLYTYDYVDENKWRDSPTNSC